MPASASQFSHLGLPESTVFSDLPSGMAVLNVKTPVASGKIVVQGAHLCEWQPAGALPVLFVSEKSHYLPGKAIRGGVPVCFPWFANRTGHPTSPAHGFLRGADWTVESVTAEADGIAVAIFTFSDSDSTRAHWPHAFAVRYTIRMGAELEMIFEVQNTGSAPFTFEAALHTYFTVSDARNVEVTGLENVEYIDKVAAGSRQRQPDAPLRFTGETDRVFVNTDSYVTIHDPGHHRRIIVEKSGSNTTVVWNPWDAKAKAMADFGDDEWPGMLCIETANSGENAVTLAPSEKQTMTARIRVSS